MSEAPETPGAVFTPRADGRYRLEELLRHDDAEFIRCAYLAMLRRAPDESGFAHYLGRLRAGAHKVELLASLRYSQEGRAARAEVDGFLAAAAAVHLLQVPLLGRLLHALKGLWGFAAQDRALRRLENAARRAELEMNQRALELEKTLRAMRDLSDGFRQMLEYGASKADLADALAGRAGAPELAALAARLERAEADLARALAGLAGRAGAPEFAALAARLERAEADLAAKADRRELGASTHYLTSMLNARLTRQDLEPVDRTLRELKAATERLAEGKADAAALQAARAEAKASLEATLESVRLLLAR
jgi:HPt (histidine-containing phosphotransfer) domain-containing protein